MAANTVLEVRDDKNIPKDNTPLPIKIKPTWPDTATQGEIAGLAADNTITSINSNGANMVAKKVATPSNLPTATAQLVIGDVASNSSVPRLRSSVYKLIDKIGSTNSANEPIVPK